MPSSIVVCGVGPGLGQAVARRYARAGYAVVLVARQRAPLEALAADLTGGGAPAYVVPADLSDTDGVPRLAEEIRAAVGDPDVLYYGASGGGFVQAAELTAERAREYLPLAVYTLIGLVQEFLPAMAERGDGAILSAQGGSALRGVPYISAPGFAVAAQRNYLQALHADVRDKGVYVGGLYIGAAIRHTPFHADMVAARAAGTWVPDIPEVDPEELAELLWTMHSAKDPAEAAYPARDLR
jgi:short-subunit dehydrogenase